MRHLLRAFDRLVTGMAYVTGALFLLISFYITADVTGRKFFHLSSGATDEIGGYALGLGGMWALAYTLKTGGHVRIDVLLPHLPLRAQSVLHYVALALMALFASVVAVYAWRLALDSFWGDARAMSFMQTPLFVPQGLMATGFSALGLEAIVLLGTGLAESVRVGRLVPVELPHGTELSEEA
ncbi:MAG: TRAP transporter small permease [Candidatus Rokubacteria bacterium]|nr:TRAP transporter small permease [Candidatus Rokubacteria bacterium]